MFTRAGMDLRRARVVLIYARIGIVGGRRIGWANLLRFRSGDLAWYCKNPPFLCWGLRVNFYNHPSLWMPFGAVRDAPSSLVDCSDAIAWRRRQSIERVPLAA